MKIRSIYIIILLTMCFEGIRAQEVILPCGVDIDESYEGSVVKISEEEEKKYRKFVTDKKSSLRSNQTVLPVVFHHMFRTGDTSVSPDTIVKIVEELNAVFANSGSYQRPDGTDTGISFCLATRDPQGNATNGLTKNESPFFIISNMIDHTSMANQYAWDPEYYINIYLCDQVIRNGNHVGGYATFPSSNHGAIHEGIVMKLHKNRPVRDYIKTVVHEMGHYLGLYHTFEKGCRNFFCLEDGDRVCDTPPVKTPAFFPCGYVINSCNTDEDDQDARNPFRIPASGGLGDQPDANNIMDYAGCRDRMTKGQADRMFYFIQNTRKALLDSKACTQPCLNPHTLSCLTNKAVYLPGDSIIVSHTSIGTGTYIWYLNGIKLSEGFDPPAISGLLEGKYTLRIEINPSDTLCESQELTVPFEVLCPARPDFRFKVKQDTLIFSRTDTFSGQPKFIVILGNQVVFETFNPDFLVKLPAGGYILCLELTDGLCKKQICKPVFIVLPGEENCYDDLDNDSDGFTDHYDNDCLCDPERFQAECPKDCQYLPDTFPPLKMKLKWMSDVISDLTPIPNKSLYNTSPICIDPVHQTGIMQTANWLTVGGDSTDFGIVIFDLRTGEIKTTKILSTNSSHASNGMVIGDVDRDGKPEIFIFYYEFINNIWIRNLSMLDHNLNIIWNKKNIGENIQYPKLADFNGDGIPELYDGNKIYNSLTGDLLAEGLFGKGSKIVVFPSYANSIAGEFTDGPGQELAAGNTVYEVDINNLYGTAGNTMNAILAPALVPDGMTAMADMDGDGLNEVIVVRTGYNDGMERSISIWNPRNGGELLVKSFQMFKFLGGVPIISDLDKDCVPEIIMSNRLEINIFKYIFPDSILFWRTIPYLDESGIITPVVFDLNNDGKKEIIVRDDENLNIIDPLNGIIVDSFAVNSITGVESPVITDTDGDGHAEIIVNGYLPDEPGLYRVFCFESANIPWAPSRVVWNQLGYHVTNVEDDLTIPRHPQDVAKKFDTSGCLRETCPAVYNSYMEQATFRTQQGCEQFEAIDLQLKVLASQCFGDSLSIFITLEELSKNAILQDSVTVSAYIRVPDMTVSPIKTMVFSAQDISSLLRKDTVEFKLENLPSGTKTILLRINDPGAGDAFSSIRGKTGLLECNYENNSDLIDVDLDSLELDLGADIIKCKTEAVTITAPDDFQTYLWSDYNRENEITVSDPGTYILNATDQCGRMYTDTIEVRTDSTSLMTSTPDIEICEGEGYQINLTDNVDWVRWSPSGVVTCDTCQQTTIMTNDSIELYVLVSKQGCIDIDTIQVTIKSLVRSEIIEFVCEGDFYEFYDMSLNQSGIYEHKTEGCDSLISLQLVVHKKDSIIVEEQICTGDSVYIGGQWFYDEMSIVIPLTNVNGCDSILLVDVTVIDTLRTGYLLSVCSGDSVLIGQNYVSQPGIYKIEGTGAGGCPSLEIYEVEEKPKYRFIEYEEICSGDSMYFSGQWITESGLYEASFQSISGCDSIVGLDLLVKPQEVRFDSIRICSGDSIKLSDQYISASGDYTYEISGASCPERVYLRLDVDAVYEEKRELVLCPHDSVYINGIWVKDSGIFDEQWQTVMGCDSVIITQVNKVTEPPNILTEVDCENGWTNVHIMTGTDWQHDQNEDEFQADQQKLISVGWRHSSGCVDTQSVQIYEIPLREEVLPVLPDTIFMTNPDMKTDIALDALFWSLQWQPTDAVYCDTCFYLHLTKRENEDIYLNLTHKSGCQYGQKIRVEWDNHELIIPNIFTPEIPGENQIWKLDLSAEIVVKTLEIYDRWGNLVWKYLNGANIQWDGKMNGKDAVAGVYIMLLKYRDKNGKEKFHLSDVTLIR